MESSMRPSHQELASIQKAYEEADPVKFSPLDSTIHLGKEEEAVVHDIKKIRILESF